MILDPVAITAKHTWDKRDSHPICFACLDSTPAPCLPYRLADALDRAQAASEGVDMLIAQAERRGAVTGLRSAAEAWSGIQVPDGRWSAGEIADWLSIKADLISEGGDF